jgi:hypothetical protein
MAPHEWGATASDPAATPTTAPLPAPPQGQTAPSAPGATSRTSSSSERMMHLLGVGRSRRLRQGVSLTQAGRQLPEGFRPGVPVPRSGRPYGRQSRCARPLPGQGQVPSQRLSTSAPQQRQPVTASHSPPGDLSIGRSPRHLLGLLQLRGVRSRPRRSSGGAERLLPLASPQRRAPETPSGPRSPSQAPGGSPLRRIPPLGKGRKRGG